MPKTIFLDCSQLICDAAAMRLLGIHKEYNECPDFGNILICLPGKSARSSLLRAIAELAPHGVLSPDIVTPGTLLRMGENFDHFPNELADQLLWYDTVTEVIEKRKDEFAALFPNGTPPMPQLPAEQFQLLRNELVHNNYSIAEVASSLDLTNPERGQALAMLESLYLEKLAVAGYDDPLLSNRQHFSDITVFEQYEKIILLNMPDLPKNVKLRLETLDKIQPEKIEIWIHAPEDCIEDYDDWGEVRKNIREIRGLDFSSACDNHFSYELVQSPEDAAKRTISIAIESGHGELNPDDTAIVLADNSLLPAFQREFKKINLESQGSICIYDPAGLPMSSLRFCRFGKHLQDYLLRPNDFRAGCALLRDADYLRYCSQKFGKSENDILNYLDEFEHSFHPDEISAATTVAKQQMKKSLSEKKKQFTSVFIQILQEFSSTYSDFLKKQITSFLRETLTSIYFKCEALESECTNGVPASSEIDILLEHLEQLEQWENKQTTSQFEELRSKLYVMSLFWENLGKVSISVIPEQFGYPVEGYLELPFLTQKNVIFCGFNDAWYPDKMQSTPFLNDSIRKRLGLRCNDESFSRAICYMRSLMETRRKIECSVHFLVLAVNADQDTMKPSPLFFCGNITEQELTDRVKRLFQNIPLSISDEPPFTNERSYSFYLKPDLHFRTMEQDENKRPLLAVTDFGSYLSSPLRYFLSRVLQMGNVDYLTHEMDAKEFGTVCHEILYRCGDRMTSDAELNRKIIVETANEVFTSFYGPYLPALIQLQKEVMLQRLNTAASVFCTEIENGFAVLKLCNSDGEKISALEYQFGGPDAYGVEFHGAIIRGKADRIEINPEKKILRIIDYKTGDVKNVKDEHYSKSKTDDSYQFKNLQLPLYVLLLQRDTFFIEHFKISYPDIPFEEMQIETAYFVLPKAVTQTKIAPWNFEEMREILPEAEKEAERIIEELKDMDEHILYEDPDKSPKYDDFREMFFPDVRASVLGITWDMERKEI